MRSLIAGFTMSLSTLVSAEWIFIDTATGTGDGQESYLWSDYTTRPSEPNYRRFRVLSVLPAPMNGVINSAVADMEVYCNAPSQVTMSNIKYYNDNRGSVINRKYSNNDTVMKRTLPKYTPGYKAVQMVCN